MALGVLHFPITISLCTYITMVVAKEFHGFRRCLFLVRIWRNNTTFFKTCWTESSVIFSINYKVQSGIYSVLKMLIDYTNERNHDEVESYQGSFKLTVVKLMGNTYTVSLSYFFTRPRYALVPPLPFRSSPTLHRPHWPESLEHVNKNSAPGVGALSTHYVPTRHLIMKDWVGFSVVLYSQK